MTTFHRQYVAYAGAVALLIGAFTPVVAAPLIGGMTLLTYSAIAGSFAIALAFCAAYLAFKRQLRALLYVGIAALAVPVFVIGKYEYAMRAIHQEIGNQSGLASTIGNALVGTVQLQWGVVLLFLSAIAIGIAGMPERNISVPPERVDRRAIALAVAVAVGVVVVVAGYNAAQGFLVSGATVTADDRDAIVGRVADSFLSDADKGEFSAAMARADTAGYNPNGETVREVIADQRAFEIAQAEAKARAEAAAKALASAIEISAKYEYIPQDPDWIETGGAQEDDVKLTLSGRNNSGKAIRAFQGTLTVENSLGNKLANVDFQETPNSDIPANATFNAWETVQAQGFENDLTSLKDAAPNRIKMEWKTTKVVFADGSTLAAATDDSSTMP